MKEPERLLQGGSALERSLLSSSHDEMPSDDLDRRVLAAMAAVPLAAGAASSSSAFARWFSSHGTSIKMIGLASVVLGAVVVGAMLRREPASAPSGPANVPAVATALATADVPPAKAAEGPREVVMTPDALPNAPVRANAALQASASARTATAPVPSTASSASIAREIELLDGVKTKLGAGSASDAARALDAYDSEFPQGTLRTEATVLRIRALLLSGDRAGAEKLGEQFLAQHPNGVHAKRVRALLEEK